MRIAFFVLGIDGMGGTERSVATQGNALAAAGHRVTVVSAIRKTGKPYFEVDDRVLVDYLVDLSNPDAPSLVESGVVDDELAAELHTRGSLLVPGRWDPQFNALVDAGCQAYLPRLESDVVVTVTPGLLATAVQLLPDRPALIHQEHRSSSDRTSGLEAMLTFVPRADVVALLTSSMADWLGDALGSSAPTMVVMPNPMPHGYKPRSALDSKLIVAAGRLVREKQFHKLVTAFAEVSDQLPDWRLRILGAGPDRQELIRQTRQSGLYDRVELPGPSRDMPTEWARASISALTSRSEGLPLVVQEAMAAGVPVVSFDCPAGAREVIDHEVNGLLVGPESVLGMASALLRLGLDEDLRRRLGEGALQSSRRYAPDAIADRWLEIFHAAIERRGRGRARRSRLFSRVTELPQRPAAPATEAPTDAEMTPAQARALGLSWAVDCARRVTKAWFVVPPHDEHSAAVVVPMTERDAFLAEFGGSGAPGSLSLLDTAGHGWPERRSTLPRLAAELRRGRTSRVSIEPWPTSAGRPTALSQGCRVDVEFWETAPGGDLVSPGLNAYTPRVAPDVEYAPFEVEGVSVRTLPLMTLPTARECTFPVDVVYTWVDGADPAWNEAREARLETLTGTPRTRESSGRARFVSRDELRYSLRSVHLFAPWVRRIHLVTAGQVPAWLADHPQVRVVDHAEILPAEALPTFNSHAIETCLHRIPDLAEHFVYFNDDFLIGRPLRPDTFFTPAGQTAVYFSPHSLGTAGLTESPPWLKAAWNNRRLLRETFGVINTHSLAHAPYAHRRSVLEEIAGRFPDVVARTARSPFRCDSDVSMLSSLAQHYGLATGTAVVGAAESAFVNLSSSEVPYKLRRLLLRAQDFICLGDHHEHALRPDVLQQLLREFFEAYLPVPAPWERDE